MGAGTTSYQYDTAGVLLTQKTDPSGKVTGYAYDTAGNLTTAAYDASGANQVTGYKYDANNRLNEVDKPDGSTVQFAFDADGNRTSKSVTSGSTTTAVKDYYQLGHVAYQTDGNGTLLATITYDSQDVPVSVVAGTDAVNGPRYYYVYNGHGDVVALVDATGTVAATYAYDVFGGLTSSTENFPNGWVNPYRYDGCDRVRYDAETGPYWMSVRAYDPTLGLFISSDRLGLCGTACRVRNRFDLSPGVSPAVVAAFAAAMRPVRPFGGAAIATGDMFGGPPLLCRSTLPARDGRLHAARC
jgi:RHS repeat-associated protein